MSGNLRVLIVGGGIGGLCLAQGLVKAGVRVAVYERDRSPDARLQGYRLNIEPVGSRALYRCLSPSNWRAFVALSGDPGASMGIYNEQLHQLANIPEAGSAADPVNSHHAISRI